MRPFLQLLLLVPILGIGMSFGAGAQTSKIMDTGIDWTASGGGGVNGHVKVYLTDTAGVSGLTVKYGTTDTTFNYFSATYTIPGNFSSSGCTTNVDNVLTVPIGHFSASVTGYLRVTVLYAAGGQSEIDVEK